MIPFQFNSVTAGAHPAVGVLHSGRWAPCSHGPQHRAAMPRALKHCLLAGRAAVTSCPALHAAHVGRSRKPGTVPASPPPPSAGDHAGDTDGSSVPTAPAAQMVLNASGGLLWSSPHGAQCPEGCWVAGWPCSCSSLLHALSHSERCWEEMRAALLAAKRGCGHQPVQPPQGRNAASEAAHLHAELNTKAGGCGPAALQAPGRWGYKTPSPNEHPPSEHPLPRMSILLMSISYMSIPHMSIPRTLGAGAQPFRERFRSCRAEMWQMPHEGDHVPKATQRGQKGSGEHRCFGTRTAVPGAAP